MKSELGRKFKEEQNLKHFSSFLHFTFYHNKLILRNKKS